MRNANALRDYPVVFDPRDLPNGLIPAVDGHMHTDWTDGESSSSAMYQRASEIGLEAILFSEHARKTSVNWFSRFAEEIRSLPDHPCRALVGVECKVESVGGDLDTVAAITDHCDLVMASVHRFPDGDGRPIPFDSVDLERAVEIEFALTREVLANPEVDILGHAMGMSCRRFGASPGQDRFRELAERAAEFGVAFEINSRYHDDPAQLLEICREVGAIVSLGSDAHRLDEIGGITRRLGAGDVW